jgi:anthranilate phosphoribosyltransferase
MITDILEKLIQKKDISAEDVERSIAFILEGGNDVQAGAFLSLLSAKGINHQELEGCVHTFQKRMTSVDITTPVLDIVGTGGDGMNTVNISTPAALIAASCGANVIKHGNRSASSLCGSADVMEALGLNIMHTPESIAHTLNETHFAYCFAPLFHPAAKAAKSIRTQLGIPTIFNLMGPLLNPAHAPYLMLGVYQPSLMPLFADTVDAMGTKRALVFHGNGTDELTTLGPTDVIEVYQGAQTRYQIKPETYGFKKASIEALKGGDAAYNAKVLMAVFNGEKNAVRDTLALNAGVGLYITGHSDSIENGILAALKALDEGAVIALINRLKDMPHA